MPPGVELATERTRDDVMLAQHHTWLLVRHHTWLWVDVSVTRPMLPYDDLCEEYCLTCRRRESSIPLFLTDPDHLHACTKQVDCWTSL